MKKFTLMILSMLLTLFTTGQEQRNINGNYSFSSPKNAISQQRRGPEEMIPGLKKQRIDITKMRLEQRKDMLKKQEQNDRSDYRKVITAPTNNNPMLAGKKQSKGKILPGISKNNDRLRKSTDKHSTTRQFDKPAGNESSHLDATKKSRLNAREYQGQNRNEKVGQQSVNGFQNPQQPLKENHSIRRRPLYFMNTQNGHYHAYLKKSGSVKQKLDSIVETGEENGYEVNRRNLYRYDANGNCFEESGFEWGAIDEMRQTQKTENTFDSNGNMTSQIQFYWNSSLGLWIPNSNKWVKTFDENRHETSNTIYYWDGNSNLWVASEKTEYLFDINGYILMEAGYYRDEYFNTWIGSYKYESAYDDYGYEIMYVEYNWDYESEQWVFANKMLQSFNEFGYYTLYSEYSWDAAANTWEGNYKEEFSYDSHGNNTIYAYYEGWNNVLNSWIGYSRDEYQYDSGDNLQLWSQFSWDTNSNTWYWYRKSTYTYDINYTRTSLSRYDYDMVLSQWVKTIKGDYYYNVSGLIWYVQEYNWNQSAGQWLNLNKREWMYNSNDLLSSYSYSVWNKDSGKWEGDYKDEYTYDSNGNTLMYTDYEDWNSETNTWIGTNKYEYSYSSDNQIISKAIYDWDGLDSWIGNSKNDYYYDPYGNRQIAADYYWDSYQNLWIGSGSKNEESYDENGNQVSFTSYSYWNSNINSWIGDYKWIQTYTATGSAVSTIYYQWDLGEGSWTYSEKREYTRDKDGSLLYWKGYIWSPLESNWIMNYKQVNTFDASGFEVSSYGYIWNVLTNSGTFDDRNEYFYDQNGFLTSWIYSVWDDVEQVWLENQKVEYTNNLYGEALSEIIFTMQPSQNFKWQLDTQNKYGYDATGNMISTFSREIGNGDYDIREEFIYDVNGEITNYIEYEWDDMLNQWKSGFKEELTYNGTGKIIMDLSAEWSDELMTWVNTNKTEFTYDTNGNFAGNINMMWDTETSQWVNSEKDQISNDPNGNCISRINYMWNESTNMWEIGSYYSKTEYSYTAGGKLQTKTNSYWITDHWQNNEKTQFTYNSLGKPVLSVSQLWDVSLPGWINSNKVESGFDINGNLLSETEYTWDGDTWDSTGYGKEREYDVSILKNQLCQSWDYLATYENDYFGYSIFEEISDIEDKFYHEIYKTNNKLILEKNYSVNYDTPVNSVSTATFYYSENVGIDEMTKPGIDLQVYPNPFSGYTTIKYDLPKSQFIEIDIFDQLGRKVQNLVNSKSEVGNHEIIWETGTSGAGIYHLKMITGDGIITRQLVISK